MARQEDKRFIAELIREGRKLSEVGVTAAPTGGSRRKIPPKSDKWSQSGRDIRASTRSGG